MRRTCLAAVAAALLAATVAQPAGAVEQTYSANGSYKTPSGNTLNQGANARVLTGDATTVTVSLECFANTNIAASATGLVDCYIKGADGSVHKAPDARADAGPVSITGDVFRGIKRQRYSVCVRARALFLAGSEFFEAPLVCSS